MKPHVKRQLFTIVPDTNTHISKLNLDVASGAMHLTNKSAAQLLTLLYGCVCPIKKQYMTLPETHLLLISHEIALPNLIYSILSTQRFEKMIGQLKWMETFHENWVEREFCNMMSSSNGIIFRVTGPLWGESTDHWCIHPKMPVTWNFDAFFDQ